MRLSLIPAFLGLLAFALTGCVSTSPAPVADTRPPVRVEGKKPGTATTQKTAPAPPSSLATAEVKPIATNAPLAARSLDERPLPGATAAVSPAPTSPSPAPVATASSEKLKTAPKGGKLPYSPENLALLKSQEAPQTPAALSAPATPVASAASAPTPAPTPSPEPAATGLDWAWPAAGKVIATFTEGNAAGTNKGVDIAGKLGDPVNAAAAGKVIHVGSEIRGLGNFVVVKHSQDFLSVYGNTSRILVKQDQMVTRGQKIAELGNSDADQPKLHFEIRQQGKPVDPLRFLPPR